MNARGKKIEEQVIKSSLTTSHNPYQNSLFTKVIKQVTRNIFQYLH